MEPVTFESCSMKQNMPPQVGQGVMLQMYVKTMFSMTLGNGTKHQEDVMSLEATKTLYQVHLDLQLHI